MRNSKSITLGFLPQGTELLAAVKPDKELSQDLKSFVIENVIFLKSGSFYTSFSGQFVPIIIHEPLTITFDPKRSGKVQKELNKCKCSSPAIPDRIFQSLNSALQAISAIYEPQRASHGGRVYDYILFKDQDEIWKPLEILRDRLYLPLAPQLEPQNWSPLPANLDREVVEDFLAQYEDSLAEFQERLKHEYKETISSNSWQNWIRQNFWLFGANYRQPFPKEKVGFDSIPDFLFATLDGFLDFLEIKLPQHKVIVSSDSHAGAFN